MGIMKKTLTVFCAAVLLACAAAPAALAEDAGVTYAGKAEGMIFEPGSEHSPTDLFADFKNVMPGASLTQRITVSNRSENKVKIYLRSLGSADEEYTAFLDQLTLTVTKGSDTPMFDAAADQTAGLTDWVCLGTLYAGGSLDLDLTLTVPETMDNTFQKQTGKLRWQFVAEELDAQEEPTGECPTGADHHRHIEEIDGISTFVCDDCGATEPVKCVTCGGNMHEVIAVTIGGISYTAYSVEKDHYATEDGRVHFYMNDDDIIDYYTVDGTRIDVKSVNEYVLYTYYECLNNKQHHTDPHPPKTGDGTPVLLWIAVAVAGVSLLSAILLRRRKKDDDEEVRATC